MTTTELKTKAGKKTIVRIIETKETFWMGETEISYPAEKIEIEIPSKKITVRVTGCNPIKKHILTDKGSIALDGAGFDAFMVIAKKTAEKNVQAEIKERCRYDIIDEQYVCNDNGDRKYRKIAILRETPLTITPKKEKVLNPEWVAYNNKFNEGEEGGSGYNRNKKYI